MSTIFKGRRIYLLMPSAEPLDVSVWTNLTKLYEHLRHERDADVQSYSSVQKKVQAEGMYKFMIGEGVYRILVKYLE